jgi:hypothetical protein
MRDSFTVRETPSIAPPAGRVHRSSSDAGPADPVQAPAIQETSAIVAFAGVPCVDAPSASVATTINTLLRTARIQRSFRNASVTEAV